MIEWTMNGIVQPFDPDDYSEQEKRGLELFEFSERAFGPRGLPNLPTTGLWRLWL